MNKILFASTVLFVGFVALFLLAPSAPEPSNGMTVTMFKDYDCSCCGNYADYLRSNGFKVKVVEMSELDLDKLKTDKNIPQSVRSCHTIDLNGYIVEGHVPVESISKMLKEKPDIDGIALPGMPQGSPGMGGVKTSKFVIFGFDDLKTVFFDSS